MTSPRTCLVTGASSGIGAAVAHALAAEGHRVALLARCARGLEQLARSIDGETMIQAADLTEPQEIEGAFEAVEQRWGSVQVLVCNAGTGAAAPLAETTDEHWQHAIALNLTAPFRCLRRAVPGMVEAGWGRVVVVASVVAKRGEPKVAAYTASKHGALGLVRSAAAELARDGVTVNAVCPGYVDTPMTERTVTAIGERTGRSSEDAYATLARRQPIGRLVEPAEVAEAVRYCVANGAVTGQGLNVDGGTVQS